MLKYLERYSDCNIRICFVNCSFKKPNPCERILAPVVWFTWAWRLTVNHLRRPSKIGAPGEGFEIPCNTQRFPMSCLISRSLRATGRPLHSPCLSNDHLQIYHPASMLKLHLLHQHVSKSLNSKPLQCNPCMFTIRFVTPSKHIIFKLCNVNLQAINVRDCCASAFLRLGKLSKSTSNAGINVQILPHCLSLSHFYEFLFEYPSAG